MLKNIKKEVEAEWHQKHELNKKKVHSFTTENFDHITNNGVNYDPFEFYEQWNRIERSFYKTNGYNSHLPIKRIFSDGSEDEYINAPEVHSTVHHWYGETLQPFIKEKVIYFIGTTAGEKYMPCSDEAFAFKEGTRFRNSYRPPQLKPSQKLQQRPSKWKQFLDRLMPPDCCCTTIYGDLEPQQDFFEATIAQRVQQPASPPDIAILLRGEHGTGKNIWMNEILSPIIGKANLKQVSLATINSRFLFDIYQSTVLHIEEINDTKRKANETLKKLITEDSARVEQKNQPATTAKKYFSIILSSNVPDPIRIERDDRRFFVSVYSTHLHDKDETKLFFNDFVRWLQLEGGLQQMCNYFHSYDLAGWDFRSPPMTKDKEDLMETETSQDQKAEKATVEILTLHKDKVFSLVDVQNTWGLSTYNARKVLLSSGFEKKRRRWGSKAPVNGWVHSSYIQNNTYKGLSLFNATQVNPSLCLNNI